MRLGEGRVCAGKAQLNATVTVYSTTWPWRLSAHVIMHTQIGDRVQPLSADQDRVEGCQCRGDNPRLKALKR